MNLYNINNNEIEVYTMKSLVDMEEYKRSQMETIPNKYRVLSTHSRIITPYNMTFAEQQRQKEIIDNYYLGVYSDSPIVKVLVNNTRGLSLKQNDYLYFLLTKANYAPNTIPNSAESEDIISVTKPLYLIQLLELRNFEMLKNEDLSEIIPFFRIPKIPRAKLPLDQLALFSEVMKCDMQMIEDSSIVYKKMKENV